MIKKIKLKNVVEYSKKRANVQSLSIDTYITTDNLLPNKLGLKEATGIPPNGNSFPSYSEQDILISNIRPYLKKIWFSNKSGIYSNDVLNFVTKESYYAKFVYYNLCQDSFFDHMMKGAKGTKMPRGDKNQILDFEIPNFSFELQKKIANILSDIDNKIDLNNQINDNLERMAKTLYDYWFVQFDFPDENGKPYKSSGGKMIWNKTLKREIPEGWELKKIKEICSTGSGGTPKSTEIDYYENGKIPWLNSGELNNTFIVSTSNFITELGMKSSSAKLFPSNIILMAMYGATAGKTSIVSFETTTNQAICAIIPNDDLLFHYIKFSLDDMYKYLINLSTGSARDNLSQNKIKDLNIILPTEKIIVSFSKIAISLFEKIKSNHIQNQQLSQLRDWLLPMLMNGQVKVE